MSPSTETAPLGARWNRVGIPASSRGMKPRRIAATSGRDRIISVAKHTPMVATRVRISASSRRMPKRWSASSRSTSSDVISTPVSSGTPNSSLSPIAAPSTSARSQATIAISHSSHNGIVSAAG